ncbi:PqqD family protein [Microbacterium sp. NPDC089698]|jgi:Coenzyme PQQ synthesis protein D (PqqD)|uniref:PqqD family protein n=1 Tax=Microbacterium sp. NPDC089698 TaxID=3364200 RepID=UPI00381204F5
MGHSETQGWRIADAVAWTSNSDGIVALDLASETAHPTALLGTAAFVWEELDANGPIDAEQLLTNLATAYEVDVEQIRADVIDLLAHLRDGGLATTQAAPAAE